MKDIISIVKRLTLTRAEKDFMRENLVVYMNLKPAESRNAFTYLDLFSFKMSLSRAVPVALAVVLAAGGVTFAAGDALPGELLYGVKVNVIEKVQSATAVGPEKKVKVQASFAEKRLKEAEKLAIAGDLTPETKIQIEEKFKAHAEDIEATLVELPATAAAEASSQVEASLGTHGEILTKISESADAESKTSIELLVLEIREVVKRVAAPSDLAEENIIKETNKTAARKTADEKEITAQASLAEAKTFFAEKREFFTSQTQSDVEAQLLKAETTLAHGKSLVTSGKFAEGYSEYRDAQSIAHEAIVALEAALELNLEITIGVKTGSSTPPTLEEEATSTPETASSTPPGAAGSESSTSTQGGFEIKTLKSLGL